MKCPLCSSKKGKRPCQATTTCICSSCCGTTRKKQTCDGCSFFQPPKREYQKIPFYRPSEMNGYIDRESISEVIESAIATYDYHAGDRLNDNEVIQAIDMLLDVFYYGDNAPTSENPLVDGAFRFVFDSMQARLHINHSELSKILGALRFVAKRRTTGRREYLQIIRQYVGISLDDRTLVRLIPSQFSE